MRDKMRDKMLWRLQAEGMTKHWHTAKGTRKGGAEERTAAAPSPTRAVSLASIFCRATTRDFHSVATKQRATSSPNASRIFIA